MPNNDNYKKISSKIKVGNYKLFYDVDDLTDSFSGFITVEFESKSLETFQLDSKNLEILSIMSNGKGLSFKTENNVLTVKDMPKDDKTLEIAFKGKFNTNMLGFYVSKYEDDKNDSKKVFSTQFEAPYARQAFPCFDQPDMKATFEIFLNVSKKYKTVLSNEDTTESYDKEFVSQAMKNFKITGGKNLFAFKKTLRMSTYLLAFVIGNFNKISKNRTEIYTPFNVTDLKFALEVADDSLIFFEKFFGVPFPLEKLKHVAIPEFSAGAMENWGLVTYRVNALVTTENSNFLTKRNAAETIAHEVAHMWFGNLVTMEWWDDLWLNEGFATFVSNLALETILKDKKYKNSKDNDPRIGLNVDVFSYFSAFCSYRGLALDSKKNSHPIYIPVSSPEEVEQIFDSVTYSKGASILRMIYEYVGRDKFAKSIQKYLEHFQYGNAKTEDLFNYLGSDINDIANNWITKQGYPLIDVELSADNESLVLKQKKFEFQDESIKNNAELLWKVPIRIEWSDKNGVKTTENILFDKNTMEIEKKKEYFIINSNAIGFYKVNYSDKISKLLFSNNTLKGINLNYFTDSKYSLFRNNYINIENLLSLPLFSNDQKIINNISSCYYSFSSFIGCINSLKDLFPEYEEYFNTFIRRVVGDLDFDLSEDILSEEGAFRILKLTEIIKITPNKEIDQYFSKLNPKNNNLKVAANYLAIRYKVYAKKENDLEFLLNEYKKNDIGVRIAVLNSLGSFTDEKVFDNAVKLLVSTEISLQDKMYLAFAFNSNYKFRKNFHKYFNDNFTEIDKVYGGNYSNMSHIIEGVISYKIELSKNESLNKISSVTRSIKKGIENYNDRMNIFNSNIDILKKISKN